MIAEGLKPLRFGIVGVVNTGLGLAVIFASKAFLDLGDLAANLCGYAIGLVASFVLNRHWTFHDRGQRLAALGRFAWAFAVAYGLNLATVFALRDGMRLNSYAAQVAGMVPYTLAFYLLSAHYVFVKQGATTEIAEPSERKSAGRPQ